MAVALETEKVNISQSGSPVPLRLAVGTELLGQYEASAFDQPQYLLRRPDGQVIQLTRLLYLVLSFLDGHHLVADIAAQVSAAFGRPVSVDNVNYLIDNKLQPLGVIGTDHPSTPPTGTNPALLGLRFRTRVVPERIHRGVSSALRPLFWPPLVLAALAAFVGLDVWLVATQGLNVLSGAQQSILHPDLFLIVIALSVAVGAFHEIGHATAARYGGAKPGVMGVGIYLMLPVFYTDVTDSYRLNRRGRLRTDLGGLYFNVIAILIAGGVYQATHFTPLLVFIAISQFEMLYQFLPFVRMDGYYVVSDLIGVPNLFAFLGPTIGRLLRRNDSAANARLQLLKPRARNAIAVWVAFTVPILALNVGLLGYLAPRLFPAMWTAVQLQARGLARAVTTVDVIGGLDHLTQLLLAAIPLLGVALMAGMLLRRIVRPVARWAAPRLGRVVEHVNQRPGRRVVPLFATAAVIVALIPLGVVAEHGLRTTSHPTHTVAATTTGAHPADQATATASPEPPATDSQAVAFSSVGGSNLTATPGGGGYWLVQPGGGVLAYGNARFYGSASGVHLDAPTVAMAATPDGHGYWLAAADGGVFTFGDAGFYGSVADIRLDQPVSAITPLPGGHGYWLGARDGGVFTFGEATFYGSLAKTRLNAPVVAITSTPDGHGYWLAATDGGVFTLGNAGFTGSAATAVHRSPVAGILVTGPLGGSAATYRLIGADGGVVSPPGTG